MVESVESADGTSIEYDEYGSGDARRVLRSLWTCPVRFEGETG